MGKGCNRRPCQIPRWLEDLNWALAMGEITRKQYNKVIKDHKNGEENKV